MTAISFTKTAPPEWLLAMWKEIDDNNHGSLITTAAPSLAGRWT